MANLTSPGVQVQVIDESFYASSGPGTVPFIMMATAQDKPQPGNATSIAPGTVKANAGKLYKVTSQRELLQTFGNPKFYTQAGTPQHGSELNEYGLYSAYQYLGLANQAWVMRADIDLSQLESTSIEPTGEPVNGDYWLDLAGTTFGVFRSNGNINSGLAWGALAPKVIEQPAQLQRIVQCHRQTQILDVNTDIISTPGDLVIAGITFAIANPTTLSQLVQSINVNTSLQDKGISAEIFARLEKISSTSAGTVYNLRLVGRDIETPIVITSTQPSLLTDLGFDNPALSPTTKPSQNYIVPIDSFGSAGDLGMNAVSQLDSNANGLVPCVQLFEKISQTTDMGTVTKWYAVGGTEAQYPGHSWRVAAPTVINGTNASQATVNAGTSLLFWNDPTLTGSPITVGHAGGNITNFVNSLNTALSATTIVASTYTLGTNVYLRLTDYGGGTMQLVDQAGTQVLPPPSNQTVGPFGAAGMLISTTYYQTITGSTVAPNFVTSPGTQVILVSSSGGNTEELLVGEGPGPTNLAAVITAINAQSALITASDDGGKLKLTSKTNTLFTIQNKVGYAGTAPLVTAGIPTGITYGRSLTYQGYTVALPQPNQPSQLASGSIWVNTVAGNRGANWLVKRYNSGTDQWTARQAPLYLDDASATAAYGANRVIGSLYVRYNVAPSDITPSQSGIFQVKIWNGTTWLQIPAYLLTTADAGDKYTQSATTPTGMPSDGTLWYSATPRVDVLVSNGSIWQGYRNAYPGTDPNGVILSATEPTEQSGGAQLVDNDLWIDTSDLENYPKIYRRDAFNSQWLLIDTTDQSSSSGILFADARWTSDGTSTGSQAISDLLVSNVVDSDAPSALPYPSGLLLFNTRFSTGNVKQYKINYLPANQQNDRNRWVTASGLMSDGAPYMMRKAQRQMVVSAMNAAIMVNEELRSETNFFNLIAAPAYPELIDEMVTLNTDKKDIAFIVVDTPARLQPDGTSIQNWATNAENATGTGETALTTTTRYGAVYYPWGLATNLDGSNIFVPPSMTVLRTIAFNDQVAYPWFAPAGFTRGLVSAVSSVGYLNAENEYVPIALSQGQRDVLYENKINPIAYIAGRGLVVYGQKTLNPLSSALDRVNVARLINYLNYNLDNLAKPFLFEPNDQFTRDSVTRTFESFFGDMVSKRAVYDFAVLCDETNNTPERVDRNELWIDVAIKPTKSIEFIYIPLRILNTGDPLP